MMELFNLTIDPIGRIENFIQNVVISCDKDLFVLAKSFAH